jgi:hypothetical protein
MEFPLQQINDNDSSSEEEALPVTSLACQWKPPKKRKESTMQISDVNFEKHVYGRTRKRQLKSLEDFDPRPEKYRGTAKENIKPLLEKLLDEGLCVSLLLDCKTYSLDEGETSASSTPHLPSTSDLESTVEAFIKSLEVSEEEARSIERKTVEQTDSPFWFSVRKYRITASMFGEVMRLKDSTRPDNLVLRIIQDKHFTSVATEWGRKNESLAIRKYQEHCLSNSHTDLTVCPCGFFVSPKYPFLGATPDGAVYDPSSTHEPYGFLEVKCPYSQRDKTPREACSSSDYFCCHVVNGTVSLRKNHPYYSQVQGQMGIGMRPWCDFVIYTTKGISIERIKFDSRFWEIELLPKLKEFYRKCVAPEIVSPMHAIGQPIRDLRN